MSLLAEAADSSSTTTTSKQSSDETQEKKLPMYAWMVKPCKEYNDEFKDCKSIKDRFNQYFVDGKMRDCNQWEEDHKNCQIWEENKDLAAFSKLIESEKDRVRKRLKNHFDNDVWEHRDAPPADWNKELPASILEKYKNTFLQFKAEEIKEKNIRLELMEEDQGGSSCSIV